MIARIWRGRVRPGLLAEYRAYIESVWLPDLVALAGNRGAYVFTRESEGHGDVITLSFWENAAAIAAFAGADIDRARYYPLDERYLLDFPEFVEHFEAG
jgi:heme-degrading monooxygenase HmoA